MLFPELFCLWAVWKRRNNYWIILELMISSDAISLNTSVNIAGRISLRLPGLWECSIFEVVCWRKTVKREGKSYCNIIPMKKHNTFFVKIFLITLTFILLSQQTAKMATVYTYIETIMRNIWGNCYVVMAHGLINIFTVFY